LMSVSRRAALSRSVADSRRSRRFATNILSRHEPAEPQEHASHRTATVVGGFPDDPSCRHGLPSVNIVQPPFPVILRRNSCRLSSIQTPTVRSLTLTSGSICHHLQSLHRPQLASFFDGVLRFVCDMHVPHGCYRKRQRPLNPNFRFANCQSKLGYAPELLVCLF
jgi:hypothetical protein